MTGRAVTLDQLLDRMQRDPAAMVVTGSSRAATAIRRAYDDAQRANGATLWTPANVLSWPQFLSTLWTRVLLDGHDDRLLLNRAQEHLVWRDLIAADRPAAFIPLDSLATLSASAWSLASAYRATSRLRPTASSEDTRTFADWADGFLRRCGRDRLLPAANLEAALEDHLLAGRLDAAAQPMLLCSLGETTPSQRSLLFALDERHGRFETIDLIAAEPGTHATTLLPDERDELRFAVRYLHACLEDHPEHTAAFIVPSLDSERAHLEPVLRELLAPELQDIGQDTSTAPWTFTSGTPLQHSALVSPLLDVAHWLDGPLSLDRVSAVLLSPYFTSDTSAEARARFDAFAVQRHLLLRPELDLRTTVNLAREKLPELAPWINNLYELSLQLAQQPARRTYADWSEWFRLLSRTAGWPGPRTLTANEHENTLAFDAVLDLLATLDFAGQRITFSEALDALQRQLTLTPTPSVASGARLLILSPAETEGLTFDAAVYMRATDSNLPVFARPHPLLDWNLQRSFAMPGTDSERAHILAQESLQRLISATGRLLFTSAEHSKSGALRPSALPLQLGIQPVPSNQLLNSETLREPVPLQTIEDEAPLPPLPSTQLHGGARLLKLQAACGFLAFAEMRLGGRELESQDAGFDALESGNVLHRALERFWLEVQDQQTLASLTHAERQEAITHAIDGAFDRKLRPTDTWDGAYLAVQKDRLRTLLNSWLEFELQRSPFTVLASENKQPIQVGPLELSLRIDRIDRLADGGLVFVDYKTGATARPSNWQSDRPEEPQLPLYALLPEPEELRGITFAKLRPGRDMQWAGWASEDGILPRRGSKRVELADEVAQWRGVLTQLAEDFAAGRTSVEPKNYAVNCKRCAQRLLCRLDLASLIAQPSTEDEEDATDE